MRRPWSARGSAVLAMALGVGLVGLIVAARLAQAPGQYGDLPLPAMRQYIGCTCAAGLVYALAVWSLPRRRSGPAVLAIILAAGLAVRLVVLAAPPMLSTDLYRYVWDGRVQAAGINPYRYLPADPALAPLRDAGTHAAGAIYPNINRADTAPTIYPPAAQALFAAIGLAAPSIWTVKAVMLGFDLATLWAALALLRAAGRPDAQVVVWAWNPLVIWEFAGGGHIDAMAVAFAAFALLLAVRRRAGWAGAAMGVAVLAKLLPAALFPAIWRRWGMRAPVAAAAVILAGYAAYASAGWRVFGYLSGYAQEEQLADGGGFLPLRLLALAGPVPTWAGPGYVAASLAALGLLALWVVRHPLPLSQPERVAAIGRGALMLALALTLVLSPHYPWYLTMLVLPAVLVPAASVLWPTIAAPLLYLDFARGHVLWPAITFIPSFVLLWFDLRRTHSQAVPLVEGA